MTTSPPEASKIGALSFEGAAGTVTGSKFLLATGGTRILVDAGMFQGLKQLRIMNWQQPAFDPPSIDSVLLTHAHLDHVGYLPRLVRQGLRATVYCTPPTRDIARVVLLDSAKLQQEDAARANRRGYTRHKPAEPLYTTDDVEQALGLFRPIEYATPLELGNGISARFHNSGHILGAAFIEMRAPSAGDLRLTFSGDVGRYGVPLHVDPEPLPACDALVLESTYGDRVHAATPLIDQIRAPFKETLARGGIILIPSFAVARVQLVALMLRELIASGDIPDVPMHVDSPMASAVTRVYQQHLGAPDLDADLDGEAWKRLLGVNVEFADTVEQSKRINSLSGPRIILASSGMLTGGRVLHHLERLGPDERNLIVLAGYQAAGTRGQLLQQGARSVRLHGRDVPIRARVMSIQGMSAHADVNELVRWLRSSPAPPPSAFLTHGEPEAAAALKQRLDAEFHIDATVTRLGEAVDLTTLKRGA